MGLYDGIKDVAKVVQQADNIELYQKLLDLSAQALDLQAENTRLKEENQELKKKKELSDQIIRHEEPVITLKGDSAQIYYCSHGWDSEQLLIQVRRLENGAYTCPHCHFAGVYSSEEEKAYYQEQQEAISMPTWVPFQGI